MVFLLMFNMLGILLSFLATIYFGIVRHESYLMAIMLIMTIYNIILLVKNMKNAIERSKEKDMRTL